MTWWCNGTRTVGYLSPDRIPSPLRSIQLHFVRLIRISPITVDATSSQGASVNYTVTATDPDNAPSDLTISCTPASGITFAIGTTTVNCSASDPVGNKVSGSFQVVVNGAATHVTNTITLVNNFHLLPKGIQTSFDSQLQTVQADLVANNTAQACSDLTGFIKHVNAQSGQALTVSQANQLLAATSSCSTSLCVFCVRRRTQNTHKLVQKDYLRRSRNV